MRSIVHNKGGTPTRWLAVVVCLLALTACDTSQPAVPTATQAAPTENPCNVCQSVPPTRAPRTATPLQPTASETPATEGTPTAGGQTSGVAAVDTAQVQAPPTIDDNLPTPTAVTATATGAEITAVQALTSLKAKALEWQADVRLAMLANVRPGQQANMLGSALGDPNVFEATPGGKGRDWTLIAVSRPAGHWLWAWMARRWISCARAASQARQSAASRSRRYPYSA